MLHLYQHATIHEQRNGISILGTVVLAAAVTSYLKAETELTDCVLFVNLLYTTLMSHDSVVARPYFSLTTRTRFSRI